jgi:hypothetical protein
VGDPPGDPGEFSPPPSPARLPNLTSPNHHQGPNARLAEHPREPPKTGVGALTCRVPPPPLEPPPPSTDSDRRPVSRARRRIRGGNQIQRSPVTTLWDYFGSAVSGSVL